MFYFIFHTVGILPLNKIDLFNSNINFIEFINLVL